MNAPMSAPINTPTRRKGRAGRAERTGSLVSNRSVHAASEPHHQEEIMEGFDRDRGVALDARVGRLLEELRALEREWPFLYTRYYVEEAVRALTNAQIALDAILWAPERREDGGDA